MQQYGKSRFADHFAEVAADSDYSRYAKLRDTTQYDIRAAAEALWQQRTRSNGLKEYSEQVTEADVIEALLAQVEKYGDDNELVSVNYEHYWDLTDTLIDSSDLKKQIERHLAHKFMNDKRMQGCTVVENQWGTWFFKFEREG